MTAPTAPGARWRTAYKEQQLGLFADRTSCTTWANQFRLLLASLAYVLMEGIRRLALKGTKLARAQVTTIRLKLLKIGAVILRNTRRVRFLLPAPTRIKAVSQGGYSGPMTSPECCPGTLLRGRLPGVRKSGSEQPVPLINLQDQPPI